MIVVAPAMCPMTTDVAALATPGMLWCSASQKRRYPHRSACCASSKVLRKASAAVAPAAMGARSSSEKGIKQGGSAGPTCQIVQASSSLDEFTRPMGTLRTRTCAPASTGALPAASFLPGPHHPGAGLYHLVRLWVRWSSEVSSPCWNYLVSVYGR